ncbi:mitochondrial antiviral-signaling protein [Pseudoliparis swirei]|uniref:mitochondrial antiviral-signaling protein n=1 Tax=Pseudoliparis swirei TaxID=2059687 RepID=UPI0024BE46B0|nr:mitochondrial antiviral-signaling protein [Pseudoliparis swirei]
MSFVSDKLYNGYLKPKMGAIVSTVKVREIMIHLPCLTLHDRETIEAKRETSGNFNGMVLLLDCLRRRERWPEQFINALEACEHTTLAAEIRAEYDSLRGVNNSHPGSAPTTVVSAHVHPAPPACPLAVPESGASSQAAPPELDARASPPPETSVQPQVPEAISPPKPVPESTPVEVAARPSAPPLASPDSAHTPATTSPAPQREITFQQEPEENSESDIQDISGGDGVTPDRESADNGEVSIDPVSEPQPTPSATDTPPRPDLLQTTMTSTEVRPPQSPSPTQMNSDVLTVTPEKPPVQDTTPPAVVLKPEETPEHPSTQVVESSPQTETSPPLPGSAAIDASLCDDGDVCLSKPSQLVSIQPQNNGGAAAPAAGAAVQPYSGDSGRLELSDSAPDAVTFARPPARSAFSSTAVSTSSALPCQESGISLNHNEPEENHYESPRQSLETQRVMTHVVHVAEEASILDLDGQSPERAASRHGEAAEESVNTPCSEDRPPYEPAPADISTKSDSEKTTTACTLSANRKYILTAAAVGACALLLARRFRN